MIQKGFIYWDKWKNNLSNFAISSDGFVLAPLPADNPDRLLQSYILPKEIPNFAVFFLIINNH